MLKVVKNPQIFTIGYEGATVEALIKTLVSNGVKTLIDVRAVPLSRKPGFSKNKLAARLAEAGIIYVGLKGLGTPAEGRAAARKGKTTELRRIFTAHLQSPEAIRDIAEAKHLAQGGGSCLLCFEHSPVCCHRLIVAEAISASTNQKIVHLDVGIGEVL